MPNRYHDAHTGRFTKNNCANPNGNVSKRILHAHVLMMADKFGGLDRLSAPDVAYLYLGCKLMLRSEKERDPLLACRLFDRAERAFGRIERPQSARLPDKSWQQLVSEAEAS